MSRRATNKRPPSVGSPKQAKKPLTLEERERALVEREEELDAREEELDARARVLAAREVALRERPPSIPPPPAPSPPPPPQALVKIFLKLNERIKLSEEFDATSLSQRKSFLKSKGRSYQHVYDGRALIVVRKLYDGHIGRFYGLFHGFMEPSINEKRNVVRMEDIMKVVRFLDSFSKKLLPEDANALLNSFRVRVCNSECMAKVLVWLNEDGEDIDNDVADDFSNRVTALLYETLPEAIKNPPPVSVIAPFLPQHQALTTSEARRNAALDEKIQFFQDWTKAIDKRIFIAESHKNERDLKAGYALHMLKEAYSAEGETSFYGIFSSGDLMETIISVARLAAKLSQADLRTFARVVWSEEQSRQVAKITNIVNLQQLLPILEKQWDREQILRVMRSVGMPENPRGPLESFNKNLPEFVEILRLLYKPSEQQRAEMRKLVDDLYEKLLEVKKGLALETRRNRFANRYSKDGQEELSPPPRPLWNRHSAWIRAIAYFELLGDRIKECGVPNELYDKVHNIEVPVL